MHYIKKFLILAGTRPEIIKLAPLFFQLKKNKNFKTEFCLTGQHKQLAFMASKVFNLNFIAPEIVKTILNGEQPRYLKLQDMLVGKFLIYGRNNGRCGDFKN